MNISIIDLLPPILFGFEGEEDGDEGNSSGDEGNSSGGANGDAGSGSSDSEGDKPKDDDTSGLKSALEKERTERKALEKKLRLADKAKEQDELAKKDEAEREKIRADKAEEKATKLAAGFLRTSLDRAINDAARKAGFLDADDALAGVDRSQITFEQDDDDPSDIEVDTKSVERAVKALATKKPHWIRTGTDDGEATGSARGGSKPKNKVSVEDQDRENYPSLR